MDFDASCIIGMTENVVIDVSNLEALTPEEGNREKITYFWGWVNCYETKIDEIIRRDCEGGVPDYFNDLLSNVELVRTRVRASLKRYAPYAN